MSVIVYVPFCSIHLGIQIVYVYDCVRICNTGKKNPGGTNAYTIKRDLKSVIEILIKKMTILNQILIAGSEMWTYFSTKSFHFMMRLYSTSNSIELKIFSNFNFIF